MELSSLIDDYRRCETELFDAIEDENTGAIRELDIRMSWTRSLIRDFKAETEKERRQQIEFFLDAVSKSADQMPDVPPIADLRTVIDRNIAEYASGYAALGRGEVARIGARLASAGRIEADVLAMIENSSLRISLFGRDMRYRYTSPANSRFHGIPIEDFTGLHLTEVIGRKRFEKRASVYLERCFAGEDLSYCFYHDNEQHGRMLLECRMLPHNGSDEEVTGAIVILRDLTLDHCDPVRSAEANLI